MKIFLKMRWLRLVILLMLTILQTTIGQQIIVNTAPLEGLDITPDNMWSFQIQSMESKDIRSRIEGHIRFRNSDHSIKYSFMYTIKPGMNLFDGKSVQPAWSFSSGALRELFMEYKVLPQGTYQYCITITPFVNNSESVGGDKVDDCIFKQSEDLFSITLIDPEDDAKLYEYNPMLSWVATYPFLNELTYRIRVAEIKEGQNSANAIARNNPVYSEKGLTPSSMIYPVYAKPLQTWQPYAWTVDAYYKGILLGGAQPWKFTIVEDSLLKSIPKESSYIDMNIDNGSIRHYAVGNIKLRYAERAFLQNELSVKFLKKGKELKCRVEPWKVSRGDNFNVFDLEDCNLKHNDEFEVIIEFKQAKSTPIKQELKFKYANPDLLN